MSSTYSKLAVYTATGSVLLYLIYHKFIQNGGRNLTGTESEKAREVARVMLQKMRQTEETIADLQLEIAKLRQQLEVHEVNSAYEVNSSYRVPIETDDGVSYANRRTSSIIPRSFHVLSDSRLSQASTVRFSKPVRVISSKHVPDPASDDDVWKTPTPGSEASSVIESDEDNVSARQLDARLETMATHCVGSLDSLASLDPLGPEYTFIAMDMETYTPLPSSHLPKKITTLITEIDHITTNAQSPSIDADIQECWEMLMEVQPECMDFLELTWRVCRAAIYLRTVWDLKKVPKKARFFCERGVEFAYHGLEKLETTHPYNITNRNDELYDELRITAIGPMIKWAGSCIGVAAEIAPGIREKIRYGFKSRDSYKEAIEIDPNDYYTYYSLARWHWEVYQLPSILRRSVNWVSPEPFKSTCDDVIPLLKRALEHFPQKYPFLHRPPDILVLMARCLLEKKDNTGAKAYAVEAKENIVKLFGNSLSVIDSDTKKEVEKVLKVTG